MKTNSLCSPTLERVLVFNSNEIKNLLISSMEPSRRSEGQSYSSDAVSFTAHSPSVRSHMRSERYIVESLCTSFRFFVYSFHCGLHFESRGLVYNLVNTVSSFRVKWILSLFFHTSYSLPSQFNSFPR